VAHINGGSKAFPVPEQDDYRCLLAISGANHYQTVRLGELLRNQSVGDALNGSAIPVKRLEYLFRLSLLGTVMGH
jgi:hypothetical protein